VLKNSGKVSKRNRERTAKIFYDELWFDPKGENPHPYVTQGLLLASVSGLILDECGKPYNYIGREEAPEIDGLDQFEEIYERVCEIDKHTKSSARLFDLQDKKWNCYFNVLQIRYFVSGQMRGMLGIRYEKRKGNRISYWISPVHRVRKRGRVLQFDMAPKIKERQVEDRSEIDFDFNKGPSISDAQGLAFSDGNGEIKQITEYVGVIDFTMPNCIRIIGFR
jgi:hypothetical protein